MVDLAAVVKMHDPSSTRGDREICGEFRVVLLDCPGRCWIGECVEDLDIAKGGSSGVAQCNFKVIARRLSRSVNIVFYEHRVNLECLGGCGVDDWITRHRQHNTIGFSARWRGRRRRIGARINGEGCACLGCG